MCVQRIPKLLDIARNIEFPQLNLMSRHGQAHSLYFTRYTFEQTRKRRGPRPTLTCTSTVHRESYDLS